MDMNKAMILWEEVCPQMRKNEGEIKLPEAGSENAVACDFFSPVDCVILPMESKMIWTDVKAKFDHGVALLLNVRSSMGKHNIMMSNTQGWIESDYYSNPSNDGNLGVMLFNLGKEPYIIKRGDRIAQGMFVNYLQPANGTSNKKRTGGFGSTGK